MHADAWIPKRLKGCTGFGSCRKGTLLRMHLKHALTVKINVRRLPFCLCCSLNGRRWIFWMSSNSWTVSEVRSRLNSSQCSRTELRSPWRKHIYRISYRCFMDSFWPFGTVRCFFEAFTLPALRHSAELSSTS